MCFDVLNFVVFVF